MKLLKHNNDWMKTNKQIFFQISTLVTSVEQQMFIRLATIYIF